MKSLTMDEKYEDRLLDRTVQGLIGKPIDRPDGPSKVTGTATYAHEWNLPDTAYGVLVQASITKGKVTAVHKESASNIEGVLAVITDKRFLRNPAQGTANKAPVQTDSEIDYLGQPIALVVAESFEAARHGAHALKIDYTESRDPAIDPEDSGTEVEEPDDGQFSQGDLGAAMKAAACTVDEIYRTPGHSSAAMEPHCAIASWEGESLSLYGSLQMLNFNINELADSLGIDPDNVRILSPFVGGGFGSKLGISPEAVAAAIASKELSRPVVVAMTRPQVFDMVMRRSESRQRLRLAAGKDGLLTGIGHEYLVSNLPGEGFFDPVAQATHFMYGGENRVIGAKHARVHRMCAGSVRAPGEAVGVQALENAMDELAEKLDMDPVELRRRNITDKHPEQGIPYSSRRFSEALDAGAKQFGWDQRESKPRQKREGEWFIGMGMASSARANILNEAKAQVTLHANGSATVETDMTDIGTGTYVILTQIAGELLGLPMNKVTTVLGDSDLPNGPGSGGSWGASSSGSAVYLACKDIRSKLCELLNCDTDELSLKDGHVTAGKRTVSITELLDGNEITSLGHIIPGATLEDTSQSTYGAHFAEVAVNSVTGETRVRRMLGAFGAGRILNEKTARSQCYGGMVWGLGIALTEDLVFDPRSGHIVNNNLAEYHVPVNLDVPQIDVILIKERDDRACPIQTKGIGELAICGAAAAITNAIYNACGVRVRDYPATLDKIIKQSS